MAGDSTLQLQVRSREAGARRVLPIRSVIKPPYSTVHMHCAADRVRAYSTILPSPSRSLHTYPFHHRVDIPVALARRYRTPPSSEHTPRRDPNSKHGIFTGFSPSLSIDFKLVRRHKGILPSYHDADVQYFLPSESGHTIRDAM